MINLYMVILTIVLGPLLFISGWLDYTKRNIENVISFTFIAMGLFLAIANYEIVEGIITWFIIAFPLLFLFYKNKLGGGDVKIFTGLALALNYKIFYMLIVLLILSLAVAFIKPIRKKLYGKFGTLPLIWLVAISSAITLMLCQFI